MLDPFQRREKMMEKTWLLGDGDGDDRNLLFGWRGWRPGNWRRPPRLAVQWSPFPCRRNRDATQICLGRKLLIINKMKCLLLLRAEAVQGIFVLTWKLVSFWALPVNWIEAKTQICLPAKLLLRASQYFSSDFLKILENIGYRILFDPSACRRRAALPSGFSSLGWVSNVSHRFWKLIEILIKSFWILGRAECIMYCRIFLLFICRPRKGEVTIMERALFLLDL